MDDAYTQGWVFQKKIRYAQAISGRESGNLLSRNP